MTTGPRRLLPKRPGGNQRAAGPGNPAWTRAGGEHLLTSAVSGLSAHDVHCRIMQQRARRNPSHLRGPARRDGSPMRDYPPITELVTRARRGDKQAWDEIVERYAPLIWSICWQYRLGDADAEDVGQMVWLHLVDHLDDLRDPAALPRWLATTTRRQCFRVREAAARLPHYRAAYGRGQHGGHRRGAGRPGADPGRAPRRAAQGDVRPTSGCRELMALLTTDPPVPSAEISARLGIRIGSIGPSRSRCLARMRRHPAIAGLIDADARPIQCEDASLAPTRRSGPGT